MDKTLDSHFLSVSQAANEVRNGRIVLIYDEQRQHEAILCLAAQFAQPETVGFLQDLAQERISVALSGERMERLQIASHPAALREGISVDMPPGLTTHDTASMLRALVDPTTRPDALAQPGPISLLRPSPGGTLQHRDYPEACSDLLRIAGLEPGAVICKIALTPANETQETDATHAEQAVLGLAVRWHVGALSIDTLLRYRKEQRVSLITQTFLPTEEATFHLYHFQEITTGEAYLALTLGDLTNCREQPPLLRLHSSCTTGDIFGSQRCDCQAQMHSALRQIAQEGRGIFLYLPQEGRGIGLAGKLQAYVLQERGYDTLEANELLGYPIDARNYDCAIEILRTLGITHARLLTNNPDKIRALQEHGLNIEPVALTTQPTPNNLYYLQTKQQRMGHTFSLLEDTTSPKLIRSFERRDGEDMFQYG